MAVPNGLDGNHWRAYKLYFQIAALFVGADSIGINAKIF